MFRLFITQCRSNWKANWMNNWTAASFGAMWAVIWGNGSFGSEKISALFFVFFCILMCVLPLIDITVPKVLYICPVSFEYRKAYAKKAVTYKILCFMVVVFVGLLFLCCWGAMNWYGVLIKGIQIFILICLNSMESVIPGFQLNQDSDYFGKMASYIGWKSTIFQWCYYIPSIMMLVGIHEEQPLLNVGCIVQWIFIIVGFFMMRNMYKKHFNLFVSMAADYETCMRYQKPIKK